MRHFLTTVEHFLHQAVGCIVRFPHHEKKFNHFFYGKLKILFGKDEFQWSSRFLEKSEVETYEMKEKSEVKFWKSKCQGKAKKLSLI